MGPNGRRGNAGTRGGETPKNGTARADQALRELDCDRRFCAPQRDPVLPQLPAGSEPRRRVQCTADQCRPNSPEPPTSASISEHPLRKTSNGVLPNEPNFPRHNNDLTGRAAKLQSTLRGVVFLNFNLVPPPGSALRIEEMSNLQNAMDVEALHPLLELPVRIAD